MSRDWSIEKYRNPLEPYEQWELKKKFMETFRDSYPEERVVSMAQVLVNIEFLGCRYPTETMKEVAELSKGIVVEFRERQKTRLQRTFVGAAEAAGAKIKGKKASVSEPPTKRVKEDEELRKADEPDEELEQQDDKDGDAPTGDTEQKKKKKKKKKAKVEDQAEPDAIDSDDDVDDSVQPSVTDSVQTTKLSKQQRNSLSQLVLIFNEGVRVTEPPSQIVSRSAQMCKLPIEYHYEGVHPDVTCTLKINNVTVARVTSENAKSAKKLAAFEALQSLKLTQYSITGKNTASSAFSSEDTSSASEQKSENQADDTGIGNRLMKLMGWSGGGLGAAKQGRVDPVEQISIIGKSGLGYQDANTPSAKGFQERVTKKLSEYASGTSNHSLVFPSEYNTEERKIIHRLAGRFGLKSTSRGVDPNRQLYISRKLPLHMSLLDFARLLAQQQRTNAKDPVYSNYTVTEPSV